ncbi:BppU family phage baseplate upper protein [Liquorilactobacillus sp.]|uniref:BppU family phage baseplate upper protein n=1 Tax=Liquorilactobacillus sp. TaxID=2767923 RepID=UPI0039E7D2F8
MNNSNYMIVDLATQQPTIKPIGDYLFARQGDNRRPLPIWFQQSGEPFALDGYTVEWAQTNADSSPLTVSGTTIAGAAVGQVTFYFPANAFAVAGTVTGHFLITKDSDGTVISSIDLTFEVTKDNVLMNIDTTPFMTDWEKFKTSISTEVANIQGTLTNTGTAITAAQEQADSIKTSIANNDVAKTSDLANYVSKSADSTVAGILTADDFTIAGSQSASDILKLANQATAANAVTDEPIVSGLFTYDMSKWTGVAQPPVLLTDEQVGAIRATYFNSNNAMYEWLPSGWIQRQINGNWNNWYNYKGVLLYKGTIAPGTSVTFTGKLSAFSVLKLELIWGYDHYFGNMDSSDIRSLLMGSKGMQSTLSIGATIGSDGKTLTFDSSFKNRVNSADTSVTDSMTLIIRGYKY